MNRIIFGDSLVGPYGNPGGAAWSLQLAARPELGIRHVVWHNGYTISDLIACLTNDVLVHRPDQVLILCGSNDAISGRSGEQITASLHFIGEQLKGIGARPAWVLPPQIDPVAAARCFGDPVVLYEQANQALKELRAVFQDDRPGTGRCILDLESIRLDWLFLGGTAYVDGLHFTALFHEYIASRAEKWLRGNP